jgi:hypothetical protein
VNISSDEHKIASINYLTNRVHTYPIIKEAKTKELNIIQDTLHNNEYNKNINVCHSKNHKNKNVSPQHQTTKWAIFIYYGRETKEITKLFKEANIKIAFRTKNTIRNLVMPHPQQEEYEQSGIHQMRCMDCPLKYIGQTGQTFNTRYKEHIQAIRSNNSNSRYSNHMLNMGHTYGSIANTMKVLKTREKRKTSE